LTGKEKEMERKERLGQMYEKEERDSERKRETKTELERGLTK